MFSKSLLDCSKEEYNISDVWQVLKCLEIFTIIFYDFYKSPGLPQGPKFISGSLISPAITCKLQNIFLWFLKVSWIARMSKITFLKFYKSWNVLQASNYFSMIFKSLLDCQKVQDIFLEVWQVLEYFSSLLDCQNVQDNFSEVLQVLEYVASFKIFFYDL